MSNTQITLRSVGQHETVALRRLAELDSAMPLRGDSLLAEVDGEIVAAYSLDERRAIADPFRHTAAAVELLETRARMLANAQSSLRRIGRNRVRLPA